MHTIVYHKSVDRKLSIVCGRGVSKRFPTHRHKSVSLGMVLKGSRILTIHKSKYIIAEGDVFIINSNESHGIGETLNPEHDYIVLSLAPALVSQYCGACLPVFENVVESTILAEHLEKLGGGLMDRHQHDLVVRHRPDDLGSSMKVLDEILTETRAFPGSEGVEVFVDVPVEECAARDTKGLYAASRHGSRLSARWASSLARSHSPCQV